MLRCLPKVIFAIIVFCVCLVGFVLTALVCGALLGENHLCTLF